MTSLNVQKALWTLAELNISCERIDAGASFGVVDTPEFRALNPNGLVPVLEDGDLTIYESHAIVRHLVRKFGTDILLPQTLNELALADQWMDWTQTTLAEAVLGVFFECIRKPPSRRDENRLRRLVEKAAAAYQILEARLAQSPFLVGDRLTMADIPAGATLYRYFDMPIERPSLPAVEKWYADLQAREAYRASVMIDYSSLAGTD